jgi:hypothetical protein
LSRGEISSVVMAKANSPSLQGEIFITGRIQGRAKGQR